MVATLFPISSAPISRCRFSSRRVTMIASGFPALASRSMVPREEAVSAVSLPGEHERHEQEQQDDDKGDPIVGGHLLSSFSARKARTCAASTSGAI